MVNKTSKIRGEIEKIKKRTKKLLNELELFDKENKTKVKDMFIELISIIVNYKTKTNKELIKEITKKELAILKKTLPIDKQRKINKKITPKITTTIYMFKKFIRGNKQ